MSVQAYRCVSQSRLTRNISASISSIGQVLLCSAARQGGMAGWTPAGRRRSGTMGTIHFKQMCCPVEQLQSRKASGEASRCSHPLKQDNSCGAVSKFQEAGVPFPIPTMTAPAELSLVGFDKIAGHELKLAGSQDP